MASTGTKSVPPRVGAPPPTATEPRAGGRLGRYELLLPLATGGMAQVWAARQLGDLGFSRLVAVKTIRPEMAEDAAFRRMFLDEARVASRLHHANIVEVLDLGEEGSIVFLAMSLVEGDSVTGLLRRWHRAGHPGALPLPIALRIAIDACAGLHSAHSMTDEDGVSLELVHRDVSPQNILVGVDGVAKIADFGIAKALGRGAEETEPGQIKGKFSYLAPEQVARGALDRRVDVFALGIVLWELVTGRRLFRGEDALETIQKVMAMPIPDPRELCPEAPDSVAEVTMRALARDRDARFPTAGELGDALEVAARGAGMSATQKEVGELVRSLAGPEIEQRRAAIRERGRSSGGGSVLTHPAPVPVGETSAEEDAVADDETTREEKDVATAHGSDHSRRRCRRHRGVGGIHDDTADGRCTVFRSLDTACRLDRPDGERDEQLVAASADGLRHAVLDGDGNDRDDNHSERANQVGAAARRHPPAEIRKPLRAMTARPHRAVAIVSLAILSAAGSASATPGDDAHHLAADSFKQAQAAFSRRDFTAAATAFEQAAQYEPHPSPLLNAAEAWSLAGQPARAATDCDRVATMTGVDEKFASEAARMLATLEPRIATLDVAGPRTAAVRIDDDGDRVLPVRRRLAPGRHLVTVIDLASSQSRRFDVELLRGETRAIDVGSPPWTVPATVVSAPPGTSIVPPPEPPRPDSKGTRGVPAGTYVALGVAGVAAGVTAVFGILTLGAKTTFQDAPTREHADAFKRDRLVTNVALAVAAASAITGVTLWLTRADSSGGETSIVVSPSGGGVTVSSRVRF